MRVSGLLLLILVAAVAAALTAGRAPAAESPGSILYEKGGKLWVASPTWSPDGTSLAWADRKGIWVGRVGDVSGQTCQLTRKLVIPGGSSPDWGPARP